MSMPQAPVLLDRSDAIATLTLNRPKSLNALDVTMIDALVDNVGIVAQDESVRVVVIRGAGDHFMAGGDLRVFKSLLEESGERTQERFHALIAHLHGAIELLARMPQPVVASVHGAVAGFGLSLMCAADFIVAADDAYFASAYRNIGITPDGGGTWSLPRIVGLRKALEIVLLTERFDAQEALRIGLVNRVVPAAEREAATKALARNLAGAPARALRNAKRLLRESTEHTLAEQLAAEAHSFAQCAAHPDFAEGVAAFLERRAPRFE
jgi:2-(1,2-epoxy-1,2-dihydrophenyl)acetyl-CoA isomerase